MSSTKSCSHPTPTLTGRNLCFHHSLQICHAMEVVELKVRLHCKDCQKAVRKALCKIKGATCVQVDAVSNKVTVLGYVDRKVVLKAVWKTGRRAEVLPSSRRVDASLSPRLPRGFRCIIPQCVST